MTPEDLKAWLAQQKTGKPSAPKPIDREEAVRLARVALQECDYRIGQHPNDWSEAAMAVCRYLVAQSNKATPPSPD